MPLTPLAMARKTSAVLVPGGKRASRQVRPAPASAPNAVAWRAINAEHLPPGLDGCRIATQRVLSGSSAGGKYQYPQS